MEIIINKLLGVIFLVIGVISLRSWHQDKEEGESILSITAQQRLVGGLLMILISLLLLLDKFRISELQN